MSDFVRSRLNMKRRILIVDDEEINRLLLQNILEKDYEVLLASNGMEALKIAENEKGRLSLILLDLLMPVMDGYEFFNLLKKDEILGQVPVVVLTSEKEAEVKSLNMGVADFIPKPYDVPEVILARISRIIQLFENRNIITATQFDILSGLFNRDFFFEYATVFDQYYPDKSKDAISLNINRFHVINAIQGRDFGNKVLSVIGETIKDYISMYKGLACRFNADSFYIYLESGEHEEKLYNAVKNALSEILDDSDSRIRIGVYKNVDVETDIAKRFDFANLACNSINGNYNKRIAFYDDKIRERELFEEKLIHDLDKALENKQFKVFYQPKFAIQSDKPVLSSAEALIRWEHPELGMISPGRFIPLFENNGLISKVDRFVWKEAANQIASWKEKYNISVPVSVNVSRADMLNEGLVDEIKTIVKEAGIDVKDYYIEVTESAYTDNETDIISVVEQLREEGFGIEMDDFGTGYSSLNMLTRLPLDVLKIDMVFVKNIHNDERELKLVESIMGIAKYLKFKVIAEGVEYEEQYELLKNLGCDVIQGYYFSKPVNAIDFEQFIKEKGDI